MPHLAIPAAIKWITATLVEWGVNLMVAAVISYTAVYAAVFAGLGALGRAMGTKLGSGGLTSGNPLQMSRSPAADRSVVYGEIRKSGPLLDAFVSGANNEYLHLVVEMAGHEVEALGDVYFNDEVEALDAGGLATGTYAGFARIKKGLGSTGQAADPDYLVDAAGTRLSSDKFDRIAYLYARFKWDQNKWPGGFPNLTSIIKGRKCFDPRSGLTVWTDNPALCVRDYLTNVDFGLAVDAATEVDDASFIAAANICDELVALAAGGTEKRYRCNGSFERAAEPATVLEKLVESMAGLLVYVGGKWICYAGAHATPESSHLTADDLRSPISVQTKLSLRDTCNRVRGSFRSPAEKWQPADFTPIVNALYLSEDGGVEIWRDMDLAFVTSPSQAQRLAKIELERTRQDITVQLPCKLTALRYKPGDVVPIDNAEMGWSGKLFLVTSVKFTTYDAQGELALGVDLYARETSAELWDWNSGEETTYDPAANTTLLDARVVAAPVGLALALATAAERTALPRIKVTWTLPANEFVRSGGWTVIEYKKNSEATWLEWNRVKGSVAVEYITDLQVGTNTDVRLKHINSHKVESAYSATVSLVAAAGDANYQVSLTNGRHGVASNAEGTVIAGELGSGGRATTDAKAWAGALALTPVASSPVLGQFAVSAAVVEGTGTITQEDEDTVRVDTMTTDRLVVRFTYNLEGVTTRTEDWALWKNFAGGAYWLLSNAAAVNKSLALAYTPNIVNFTGKAKLAASSPADYAGRFKIALWTGGAWVDDYSSAGDETAKAYTVPAGTFTKLRCQLYLAGGFSTFLDEIEIPITYDGNIGPAGANATRTAILDMYQWAASAPVSFPTGTASVYTWATGQFTAPGTPNGWSLTPGTPVAGQTLYVCRQIFADALTTATSNVTWSASTSMPISLAGTSGSNGTNGQRVGILELYQWAAVAPTTMPVGTSTYTWATGAFTAPGTLNSWALTPGAAVAGQTLWGILIIVSDTLTTATSTSPNWNTAGPSYAVGAAGTNGTDGGAVVGTASGTGNFSTTSFTDVLSAPATAIDGNTHQITASIQMINQHTAARLCYLRLYRDSTAIGTPLNVLIPAGPNAHGSLTVTAADTPGAGTYTYSVKGRVDASPGDTDTDGVILVQ